MIIVIALCFACVGCIKDNDILPPNNNIDQDQGQNNDDTNQNDNQDNEDTNQNDNQDTYTGYKIFYADTLPVIDGEIDEIWMTTEQFKTKNFTAGATARENYDFDAQKDSYGYMSVMWTEDGLYFLGVVYDIEIVDLDRCNFWVSETYLNYVADGYDYETTKGSYSLCLNPKGIDLYYNGIEAQEDWVMKGKEYPDDAMYVVEAYIPVTGAKNLRLTAL